MIFNFLTSNTFAIYNSVKMIHHLFDEKMARPFLHAIFERIITQDKRKKRNKRKSVSMDTRKSKRFAETKFISRVRRTVGAIRVLTGRVIKQVPREGEGGAILSWVPLTPGQ